MKVHMQAEINKSIENVLNKETITAGKDLISINIREGL